MISAFIKRFSGTGSGWPRFLCLGVSVLLMWIVLRRVDLAELKTVLARAEPGWWFAALLFFGTACVLGAIRWRLMLGLRNIAVPLPACYRATLAGHFLNTLFFGPAGGDIVKSYLFGRWHRQPTADLLAASWLDRLVAGIGSVVFALLLLGLADWQHLPELTLRLPQTGWMKPTLLALAAGAVVVVFARHRHQRKDAFLRRTVDGLLSGLKNLAVAPRLAFSGVVLGLLVQVLLSSVLMLCLRAVTETPLDWPRLFWTFPVISLLTALPISVAGVGVREGSSILLLGLFGVPTVDALGASLLALGCNLTWAVLGGLVLAWEEHHQKPK